MTNVAVICEYDPFHRGHRLQIETIRQAFGADTTVISLMSGDVVQRGRLALYSKHTRAEAALACGSDLVLELPAPYACASAEAFARGAVEILNGLGGIDILCFGSETGDLASLTKTAAVMASPAYLDAIRQAPEKESHMRNAEAIFRSLAGDGFPTLPNDILGVEYLSSLSACQSAITPFTYRREEGYSASEARRVLTAGGDASSLLPEVAWAIFAKASLTPTAIYDAIALHTLRSTPTATLEACYAMNGGVAGLLKHRAEEATSVEELIALCTSRKFSAARLRRGALAAVLSYTPEQVYTTPRFTRLLGANDKGRAYLAKVRKTTSLPIVTKPADGLALGGEAEQQFEASLRADKLMALVRGESSATCLRRGAVLV